MPRTVLEGPKQLQFDYMVPGKTSGPPQRIKLEFRGTRDGVYMYVHTMRTWYERALLEYLWTHVPHDGIWIDVGAHIGNHTVFFAKFTAGMVIAIEPCAPHVEALKINVEKNGVADKVRIIPCAAGPASFASAPIQDYLTGGQVKSRMQSIDDIMASTNVAAGEVQFIKIDTDGHEPGVLQGAAKTIERHRPFMVVEVIGGSAPEKVPPMLTEMGYEYVTQLTGNATNFYRPKQGRPGG